MIAPRAMRNRTRDSSFSGIFHQTTTSTPASVESGIKLAEGAATSMKTSKNPACIMPATGLRAPGLNVDGGARYRPRHADPAQQSGGDVRYSLSDELHI